MIRNLKVLGLALVAVFALSALAASVASAQVQQGTFTSSNGTAQTLIGTETGLAGSNAYTSFGSRTECPGSTYTAHKYNVTPHVAIPNKETTFTITPHYKNCVAFNPASHPMTVTMNGCDYVLHIGLTTGGVLGTYGATLDIVCPPNKVIEKHVYNDAGHTELLCTMKIKAQNGLAGAHFTNTPGTGTFDLQGTFAKIHVEREGLCLLDGKGNTTTSGELDTDLNIKSSAGVGVSVTDTGA
jgi:hypothetical protein